MKPEDLTGQTFIGYCQRSPAGNEAVRVGWIKPLAHVLLVDGKFVVDGRFDIGYFGESGKVQWRAARSFDYDNLFVRFTAKANPNGRPKGEWYWVQKENSVKPLHLLLNEADYHWPPSQLYPKLRRELPLNSTAICWSERYDCYLGPWKLEQKGDDVHLVPPHGRKFVFRLSSKDIPRETIFEGQVGTCIVDFEEPQSPDVLDLCSTEELAEWLVKRIRRLTRGVIGAIASEETDWDTQVKLECEELSDETKRQIHIQRWRRAKEVISTLELERELLFKLLKSEPDFIAMSKEHIRVALDTEMEKLRRNAKTIAEESTARALEGRRRELSDINEKLLVKTQELAAMEKRAEDASGILTRLSEVSAHLDESQARLVHDACVQQGIPSAKPGRTLSTTRPKQTHNSPVLDVPQDFVSKRLFPMLRNWVPNCSVEVAKCFHYGVIASPWMLLPTPVWARAYHDALASAELMFVQVETSWLSFKQALQGKVLEFWQDAVRFNDRLFILCFVDLNRSAAQVWSAPLLGIRADVTDSLPLDEPLVWPRNLRVFSTIASDSATLPLERSFLNGVTAVTSYLTSQSDDTVPVLDGHVPFSVWQAWCGARPVDAPACRETQDLGYFARSAANDLLWLEQVMLRHGESYEFAQEASRNLRLRWPLEYE